MSTVSDKYSTESMYLDGPIEFEKVGMQARLSDNSDTWVQEVLQELMKQHPYLGQYDVVPEMTQVEGDKGYGFGYFNVTNKTSATPSPGGDALAAESGVKTIRIPIIIKDQKVSTFDVFIGPKAYPITEERVRQAMFRPQLFDSTGKPPEAGILTDKLYPPGRTNSGLASQGAVTTPSMKLGSAKPYLMEAIGNTINSSDLRQLEEKLGQNMKVATALAKNETTLPFMRYLASVSPLSSEDIAKVASGSVQPNVVSMTRASDGYHLKMASSELYSPEEIVADRPTMEDIAGKDMVSEVDETGVSTVSIDPVVHSVAEDEVAEDITRFGEYRVKTLSGDEMLGWVFPKVLDFDGTQLPMTLFSNGAVAAMQDKIVGSFVGVGTNVIRADMVGNGFFYRVTSTGSVIAFVPGQILNKFKDETGEGVVFESVLGERSRVRFVPGLRGITKIGDDEFAIPGDVRWLTFDSSAMTKLIDAPMLFAKTASAKQSSKMVEIISDGETWSFKGGCGLNKLAHEETTGLDSTDALFLGCVLGMDELTAMRSLAVSGQQGSVKVAGCRMIKTAQDRYEESMKRSKEMWAVMPPRYSLLKEASSLEDAMTVDKVLSIGFLNPENIATFVNYLPEMDATVSKLAELLVAVRIGLKDLPEVAVKNAMERLNEVTTALKALMYRAADPSA